MKSIISVCRAIVSNICPSQQLKCISIFSALVAASLIVAGCEDIKTTQPEPEIRKAEALYAATPIKVDGKLTEEVWQKAPVYELKCPLDRLENGDSIHQCGKVRFAWDDNYIYVAGKFEDRDIQANGKDDGMHHYQWGDVMEVFLWPQDNTCYWEMYCTPLAKKTTFFFPAPGHLGMKSCFEYKGELEVAAAVDGSVNKWGDEDKGWTCEFAVPKTELSKHGDAFAPTGDWRVLVGRYNYCSKIDRLGAELSSFPQLTKTSYHLREQYAKLVFIKK